MEQIGLSLQLLSILIGITNGQVPSLPNGGLPPLPSNTKEAKPLCDFSKVMPCINGAIMAYTKNTRGEEAAIGPINPVDAQIVNNAMSSDLFDPRTDMNATCDVLVKIEPDEMGKCFEDIKTAEGCTMDATDADEIYLAQLPAFRDQSLSDTGDRIRRVCNQDCLLAPLMDNIAKMRKCWKDAEDDLALILDDNITDTPQTCSSVEYYLRCQWKYSVGCPLLEHLNRKYLKAMEPVITRCMMVLPPEALIEPEPVSNSACGMSHSLLQATLSVVLMTQVIKNI